MLASVYGIPQGKPDHRQLTQLLLQAFLAPKGAESAYIQRLGLENFRVLHQGDRLVAGLGLIAMGQWFGGHRVAMTGVGSVAVAPEWRGAGLALDLMQGMLQELYDRQTPLSVLYPATQALYRKLGYGQAGHRCGWSVPTETIRVGKPRLSIQPLELKLESFQALYQCQAQGQDGFLDRVPMIWKMILEPDFTQSVFAYGFGGGFGGDLSDCAVPLPHQSPYQGYVIFKQVKEEEGSAVQVLDWVLLTPDAVQTFWALMANHRSMIDRVQWCSGAIDDLSVLLPEQTARLQSCQRWLARIIHLPTALADRGYPLGQWQLHLWVEDERLPGNAGNWLLSVDQGQAQVTPGGRGELRLRIETLVTLYTGLFSPYQLQRLGLLEAEAGVLAIAQQIFPLSSPWTPDFF